MFLFLFDFYYNGVRKFLERKKYKFLRATLLPCSTAGSDMPLGIWLNMEQNPEYNSVFIRKQVTDQVLRNTSGECCLELHF